MTEPYVANGLYATCEVTESPETSENIPVIISWWHHPAPDTPEPQAAAAAYRKFIRVHRLHEHMAHYLTDPDGHRTYLSLIGTRGRMRRHPLDAALREQAEMPLPDPIPADLGHAAVTSDVGMYVLVASPLPAPPTFQTLTDMVEREPEGVGMARFEIRADDQARRVFAEHPLAAHQLSDDLVNRVVREEDPALRSALQFLFGIQPGYLLNRRLDSDR